MKVMRESCRVHVACLLGCVLLPLSGCMPKLETVTQELAQKIQRRVSDMVINSVAVSDFVTGDSITGLGEDASNYMVDHLAKLARPSMRVYDRTFLRQQLEEHNFQWSNYARDWSEVTPYGDKAPARLLIVGRIDQHSGFYDLRVRALDLHKGEVLLAEDGDFRRSSRNDARFAIRWPIPTGATLEPIRNILGRAADELAQTLVADLAAEYPKLRLATTRLKGPDLPREMEYGRILLQKVETALRTYGADMELQLVLSRADLADFIEDQVTEHSPFFREDTTAPIDQAVGAHAYLCGTIDRLERGCHVHLDVIDLETKVVLATADLDLPPGEGQDQLFELARR